MNRKANTSRQLVMDELVAEIRAAQSATDAVDHAVAEMLGINRTDQRILDLLTQRPERRMTAGELAEQAFLSTAAITAAVDRLERKGYVKRVRDDADRRRVFVEIDTLPGPGPYAQIGREGEEAMSRYSTEDLAKFRDFMRISREINERAARRLRET
jgi:DNA-binding Lrp family transcriptional regulator